MLLLGTMHNLLQSLNTVPIISEIILQIRRNILKTIYSNGIYKILSVKISIFKVPILNFFHLLV